MAICDKRQEGLRRHKESSPEPDMACYTDFDDFIRHDMDALIYDDSINRNYIPSW